MYINWKKYITKSNRLYLDSEKLNFLVIVNKRVLLSDIISWSHHIFHHFT